MQSIRQIPRPQGRNPAHDVYFHPTIPTQQLCCAALEATNQRGPPRSKCHRGNLHHTKLQSIIGSMGGLEQFFSGPKSLHHLARSKKTNKQTNHRSHLRLRAQPKEFVYEPQEQWQQLRDRRQASATLMQRAVSLNKSIYLMREKDDPPLTGRHLNQAIQELSNLG